MANRRYFALLMGFVVLAASDTRPPWSQLQIVSPAEFADREAPAANIVTAPMRFQQVYPASDFAALNGQPQWITQIAFRSNGSDSASVDVVYDDIEMWSSITRREPGGLSDVFDDNIEGTRLPLYDGPLAFSPADAEIPERPKGFNQAIPLENPMVYDPANGNLLLEVRSRSGASTAPMQDFFDRPLSSLFAADANTGHGTLLGGLVTQFTLHPKSEDGLNELIINGGFDDSSEDASIASRCARSRTRSGVAITLEFGLAPCL